VYQNGIATAHQERQGSRVSSTPLLVASEIGASLLVVSEIATANPLIASILTRVIAFF
jgi:hypothetical protein